MILDVQLPQLAHMAQPSCFTLYHGQASLLLFTVAEVDLLGHERLVRQKLSRAQVSSPTQHERVSGSALGGGTFTGLCRLLTGARTFDDMLALAAEGDNTKVRDCVSIQPRAVRQPCPWVLTALVGSCLRQGFRTEILFRGSLSKRAGRRLSLVGFQMILNDDLLPNRAQVDMLVGDIYGNRDYSK